MDGDINRTIRLNPKSQESIKRFLERMNEGKSEKKWMTVNKAINKMIQEVGSEEYNSNKNLLIHITHLQRMNKHFIKKIKQHAPKVWDNLSDFNRNMYDDYDHWLSEVWHIGGI